MLPKSLKLNFSFNLAGIAIPVAVSLVTIPIYIGAMGESRYGILAIVWLLLGYFGFLDLGLSRASANALARLGDADADKRGAVLAASAYLNGGLGLLGGLLIFLAGDVLFATLFGLSPGLVAEVQRAMPWIAAMLPLALLSGVGIGALESKERFFAANLLQVAGTTAGQVIPALIAVWGNPGLDVVLPAAFLVRLASLLLIFVIVAQSDRVRLYAFDRGQARSLFRYGAWVSVTNIIGPILTSFDQFVIGAKLGPAAVSHYAVPMGLTTRAQGVAAALARALFPRLSRYDRAEAADLAERATLSLAYVFGAVCAVSLLLAGPFFALWINPGFSLEAAPVARILLLGAWINGLAFLALSLLQGQGRPDLAAKIHALELVPFILLLWALITHFGLVGAAAAWTCRVGVDALIFFWVAELRSRRMARLLPALLLLLAAYGGALLVEDTRVLMMLAVLVGGAYLGLGLCMDETLRLGLKRLLAGRVAREGRAP